MPSALLWASSAEYHFYICRSGKSADFPDLPFHEREHSEKRQLPQKKGLLHNAVQQSLRSYKGLRGSGFSRAAGSSSKCG